MTTITSGSTGVGESNNRGKNHNRHHQNYNLIYFFHFSVVIIQHPKKHRRKAIKKFSTL